MEMEAHSFLTWELNNGFESSAIVLISSLAGEKDLEWKTRKLGRA